MTAQEHSAARLTDHDDRVRVAGVLGLVLLASGLSLAILFVLLQLVRVGLHERHDPPAAEGSPSSQAAGGLAARQLETATRVRP